MPYIRILFLTGLFCFGAGFSASAQSPTCGPEGVVDSTGFSGTAFFNYGSSARLKSQNYRSALAVGQTFIGYLDGLLNNSTLGFYSRFLLAPFALQVKATQGDLLDRIQLSWEIDASGPSPTGGFNIYRDNIFLATVGANIRSYNDFNVIPGVPYNYTLRGLNAYGEGASGHALGFQVPNGVVTGWVQTLNGSPVPDAMVTLMPMQGFSAKFGPMDGAFAGADTSANPLLPAAGADWTMTFWIKTDLATLNAGLIQMAPFPLYIRALSSAGGQEGVAVATSATGAPFLSATFADSTKNGWHHVALSFDGSGGVGRLYIDGVLAALAPMNVVASADELNLGARTGTGGWTGRLDELRIYFKLLDELDFREVMEGTASSLTPNLSHYWKMDEGQGLKSYDILKRHKLYFCGATFDAQRPPVRTAGKTNQEGYYRIESASYGTGTTFLAQPMKDFYMHRALKMVRNEQDYVTLPDFPITAQATLELWLNSAGPEGTQCLLSKKGTGNDFRLLLKQNGLNNEVWFYLNGQEQNFGNLGMGYQHLAFTIDSSGSTRTVTAYKNGAAFGSPHVFTGSTGNWSDTSQVWVLGARPSGAAHTDHFGGLMDELAFYNTILSPAAILDHFQHSRDMQESGLRVYYAIDEGSGNNLNNSGSAFLPPGTNVGADWSPFAANQSTEPHVFTPSTRQVTLNPSVTSVDQVDFTDRSTIPVSGFVRYKGTDCFAKNVEILVNGASYFPAIYTDSTGKFLVELDPGASVVLSPKLEDHVFSPASRAVFNVTAPIAGIIFNDLTTRKIKGQVAGGQCKLPIISPTGSAFPTDCRITVSTKDKCYEKTMLIDTEDGLYEFDNLPPLELTIAITKHNNPKIYDDFQTQGGRTINLLKKDSIGVDFIYIAPPQVQVLGFEAYSKMCPPDSVIVLGKMDIADLYISAYEQYGSGQEMADRCYLDSATVSINNTFDYDYNFQQPLDTLYTGGQFHYRFIVDHPNPDPPHLRIIEIIADDHGRKSEPYLNSVIVTGAVPGEAKFTTQLPVMPSYVLRDPPGDASFSYLEANKKVCNTLIMENEVGGGPFFESSTILGIRPKLTIPFVGIHVEAEATYAIKDGFESSFRFKSRKALEYCVTNKERINTDDGDLIVGDATILGTDTLAGADVYVGIGFNVIFSDSRDVIFDTLSCQVNVKNVVTAEPDTFITNYKYSEWNIQQEVVRYLDTLIVHGIDQDSINTKSKNSWLAFIAMNKAAKKAAVNEQNISFDAGVTYEASVSTDNTTQWETTSIEEEINRLSGVITTGITSPVTGEEVDEIGFQIQNTNSQTSGNSEVNSITTGYVLKDDDPGDNWTVDVKKDPLFHTPVFTVIAGQSSCPWEVGTAHRQGVAFTPVDGIIRTNVPSNEAASFHFILGNNSSSGETWSCVINTGPESNPDGLVIRLNGNVLDQPVLYAIPWGTTVPVTVTVERGPDAYDYGVTSGAGCEVVAYSLCHDERCSALGIPPDFEPYLYSANYLKVQFLKPCSEVDITGPFEGWVVKPDAVNPASQNLLPITVSGYDLGNSDFQAIRLQYRPEHGDGAWINITPPTDIPKADLGPAFTTYQWDTGGSPPLADGPYELRAVSICTGGGDKNGYSHIIKGRIDRQPPSLIGTPEPADGVYNVGDEISFSFNKQINCSKINPVDNVQLFDATTNLPIDIAISCYENKIILVPNFENKYFENRILRAELHDIEDLTGNKLVYTQWEFYVDRNELAWLTDSLGMTKFEDQTKTATANIHNRGGYPVPFTITGVPAWVHVVPNTGTLAPNEIRPISFTVDSSLAFGLWSDSITLHTETGQNPFFMGGDEGLPIGVRVVCRPPNWDLNANVFENSENMVLELNIQGLPSTDVEDMVVAYVGDTLVGRAHVQYVPEVHKYLAYLTIYGNQDHVLAPLRLEIWDASACLRYAVVEDYFLFQPDDVIGDPLAPQVIHTNNFVLRELPLGYGWNWMSFNLAFPHPDLDSVLVSLNHPQNDLMKGQNAFSIYLNGTGWLGSLDTLGNKSMYIYRADQPDTLHLLGTVLNPATTSIPVVNGWNWIGYIPNYSLPVNTALASLAPQTGDLIKSQVAFAQYINPAFGWIGNLKYMSPPNGYQLKISTPGTLTYPPSPTNLNGGGTQVADKIAQHDLQSRGGHGSLASFWTVDPTQFENSMTLIGMLSTGEANATTATMELGAFAANGEVRGSGTAIYIAPLQSYLFFLTVYSNVNGEQIHYKLFDSSTGAVQSLMEQMYFSPDLHQGSIEQPVPFTLPSSGTQESVLLQSFEVQPNPFHTETMFRFALPGAQDIALTVTDIRGRTVSSLQTSARQGLNTIAWRGQSDAGSTLAAGVYFVRLQTASGSVVRKVVLQ